MEKSIRNKWLNSFVRITSGNAKTDDDPIYIVYKQQNGWCTLHNIKDSSCKIVKQCDLTRIKLVRICLPLPEVERVLKVLKEDKLPRTVHSGYSKSWQNLFKELGSVPNKYIIIRIINSKYPENLYFNWNCPLIVLTDSETIRYSINLTKLIYKSEKIVRN